jgi:hypothetical protein
MSFLRRSVGKAQDLATRAIFGKEKPISSDMSFYSLVDRNMAGEEVPMSNFKGKVLCVVNVASK